MTERWFDPLLGKPWQAYATGPDFYDCWGIVVKGLVEHYQLEGIQRYLDVATDDYQGIEGAVMAELATGQWQKQDVPTEGAVMIASQKTVIHHIGLFTHNGVLHAREFSDVCHENIATLKMLGFKRLEFYLHVSLAR